MRFVQQIVLAFFFIGSISTIVAAEPVKRSLQDFYQLTLARSEDLKRRVEDVNVAQAQYDQALAVLYPKLHFIASQQFRDSASGSSNQSNGDFDSGSRSNSKHPFDTRFNVTQPIFNGFRDLYIARAAEAEREGLNFDQQRFAETLYLRVAELFHQIGLYQSDLKLYDKTGQVLAERVTDLRRFIDLGKSKESEVLAAESDRAALDAAREQTKGLLGSSKEVLAFFSGIPSQDIAIADGKDAMIPASLEVLLKQSADRLDLQAQSQRKISAEYQLKAAERLRWPDISLEGNYYPYQEPDREQDASMILRFDLPLYEGGAIQAKQAEQQARLRQSVLSLEELRRIAEREIRVGYSDFQASLSQVEKLKAFLQSTRQNLESQRKDYSLGVVTNLDVLQAIRAVYDAEDRLLEVQAQSRINFARLKVAVGGIS